MTCIAGPFNIKKTHDNKQGRAEFTSGNTSEVPWLFSRNFSAECGAEGLHISLVAAQSAEPSSSCSSCS